MNTLLQQIQSGEQEIQTSLDVSEMGKGNRRVEPGRWRGVITDAFVCQNKKGGLNCKVEVEIQDAAFVGCRTNTMSVYPSVDPGDENYGRTAWFARSIVASALSASGGKEKVEAVKAQGSLKLDLSFKEQHKSFGPCYTVNSFVGKDVYVRTGLEADRNDASRHYSRIEAFIAKEEYEAAPGKEENFTFSQKGSTTTAAAPTVNTTVKSQADLATPGNGAPAAAAAAMNADDLLL